MHYFPDQSRSSRKNRRCPNRRSGDIAAARSVSEKREVTTDRPFQLNALHLGCSSRDVGGSSRGKRVKGSIDLRSYKYYYNQDEDGDTLLHILISRETFKHAFFIIGITPEPRFLNMQNCNLLAPLHLAVLQHEHILCRRLLLAGASLRLQSPGGNTPLHLACKNDDYLCVKALTEPLTQREVMWLDKTSKRISRSKRDFDVPNHQGLTGLHVAVSKGNLRLVEQLTRSGADVRAKEGLAGMSSLHLAVFNGRRDVARYLAHREPRLLEQRTMAGLTPYQMARSLRDELIAEDLKELGACTDLPSDEEEISSSSSGSDQEDLDETSQFMDVDG